jgi:hypothetical protein
MGLSQPLNVFEAQGWNDWGKFLHDFVIPEVIVTWAMFWRSEDG